MEDQARTGVAREMAREVLKKYAITQPGTPLGEIAKREGLEILYRRWPNSVGHSCSGRIE